MSDIPGLLAKYAGIEGERFFHDVFTKGEYKAVKDIKGKVALDIGALAGEFSAYVYDNFDQIYAIEPILDYFTELEDNITEFGLNKIKPRNLAIAGENGKKRITVTDVRGGNHFTEDGGVEVEAKTLATFLKDEEIEKVDLLKIDVENAEDEIFRAEDIQEAIAKIDVVVGEHLGFAGQVLKDAGFTESRDSTNVIYTRQ